MRKTIGKLIRKYLFDKRLGERRVVAIYRDGKKIWPTLSDTVYSCVLDVAAVEGSLDWAYWLHALDAVEKLGARADCYIKLTAGGRDYMLGKTFRNWYVAGYDGRATVVFGDDGPLCDKLKPGDEVRVQLRVPGRKGADFATNIENTGAEGELALPPLRKTGVYIRIGKGKKKQGAPVRMDYYGVPSGVRAVTGTVDFGSGRGERQYVFEYNGDVRKRDYGAYLAYEAWGACCPYEVCPMYPGFTRVIRFKVSAVTRHG